MCPAKRDAVTGNRLPNSVLSNQTVRSDGLLYLSGAGDRNRTYDPIITNDVLYQLSYSGVAAHSRGNSPSEASVRYTIAAPAFCRIKAR